MASKYTSLAEDYLAGRDGDVKYFLRGLRAGQRLGQAFYNALSDEDQDRITIDKWEAKSLEDYDCFHDFDMKSVERTIEWLLDTE